MYDLLVGDCLESMKGLKDNSVHCTVTSPPYFNLRDYHHSAQVGREDTPGAYTQRLVEIFREVRRVLRPDGTLWLNLGDSYATSNRLRPSGIKRKDLMGIPWRTAFALQEDGWHLRCDAIWSKTNSTPESVPDRPSRSHEYVFLLAKSPRYYYDREAIREPNVSARPKGRKGAVLDSQKNDSQKNNSQAGLGPDGLTRWSKTDKSKTDKWGENPEAHGGFVSWNPRGRNRRSVWTTASSCFLPKTVGIEDVTHFAAYPPRLITPCILAGTAPQCCAVCAAPYRRQVGSYHLPESEDGWHQACDCGGAETMACTVLDPFAGTGTTGATAIMHGRRAILCELNPDYGRLAEARCLKAIDLRALELKALKETCHS